MREEPIVTSIWGLLPLLASCGASQPSEPTHADLNHQRVDGPGQDRDTPEEATPVLELELPAVQARPTVTAREQQRRVQTIARRALEISNRVAENPEEPCVIRATKKLDYVLDRLSKNRALLDRSRDDDEREHAFSVIVAAGDRLRDIEKQLAACGR